MKMKKTAVKITALLLSLAILALTALTVFAGGDAFKEEAYVNIVTVSDCQDWGSGAYARFAKVLKMMKNDGLPEPDSVLSGGDYSRIMNDYAPLGILELREAFCDVYPGADADKVICIQGNHDLPCAAFFPTGLYDMGTYSLYLVNEDDFPWEQYDGDDKEAQVKKLAKEMDAALGALIRAGDTRPVIVLTHVPLHHSRRSSYGDNMYSHYVFNVLNRSAQTLDIIFMFGHNHSGTCDDYIGGSINYMAPGDTINIPSPEGRGSEYFTEETLNFTYLNCGYIGYCKNTENETSTNVLTLGLIRFFPDRFEFFKYSEKGLLRSYEVDRKNPAGAGDIPAETEAKNMTRENEGLWNFEKIIVTPLALLILRLFAFFA